MRIRKSASTKPSSQKEESKSAVYILFFVLTMVVSLFVQFYILLHFFTVNEIYKIILHTIETLRSNNIYILDFLIFISIKYRILYVMFMNYREFFYSILILVMDIMMNMLILPISIFNFLNG